MLELIATPRQNGLQMNELVTVFRTHRFRFSLLLAALLGFWSYSAVVTSVEHPWPPVSLSPVTPTAFQDGSAPESAAPEAPSATVGPAEEASDSSWLNRVPGMLGLPGSPSGANTVSQFATSTELLGPLTPLALSPYFGITVLSGMTQVPESWPMAGWLTNNRLLGTNPVLRHPATFWIFLLLTCVTSLPRFTKVTKPVAQALDGIEAYSGLITSLIILVVGLYSVAPESTPAQMAVQAGILMWTWNAILLVAAIINFIVVKSVRFLFEMLIWISPIPFVDACFELANKAVCLVLLFLYAFSPLLALIINLFIFVACLLVMNWAQRRVNYHWHLWLEPVIQWLYPAYRKFDGHNLWVYCEQDFPPFRKYDRLHLYRWDGEWMLMRYDLFWQKKFRTFTEDDLPMLETIGRKNALVLQQQVPVRFCFHRGYTACLDEIAKGLGISTKQRVDYRANRLIREAEEQEKDQQPGLEG